MKIRSKYIGYANGCFIIAEIGQAHDGSLGTAHAYIDLAKKVGADAVKFQTHIAKAESSSLDEFRVDAFPQDKTRFDYWERTAFSEEQWYGLFNHANELNLTFLSSPFSFEAVDLLERIGVPAWKVASGELNNQPLINRLARTKKPVFLSSGMSSWEELDLAVDTVKQQATDVAVFQCTSSYPCPLEDVGINLLDEMSARYKVPVGLSDHSGSIFPSIIACARGASLIEAHLVFSRESFGPDTSASLTGEEFTQMVRGIRETSVLLQNVKDKDELAKQKTSMRRLFTKSIYAASPIEAGTVFDMSNVCLLKPGIGLQAIQLDTLLGQKAAFNYRAGELIRKDELNEPTSQTSN